MGDPSLVFSDHAERQLQERELSREIVIQTVRKPDGVVEGRAGRKIAQRVVHQGGVDWLFRVVYVEERGKLVIVTMYRTTKISKYLKR